MNLSFTYVGIGCIFILLLMLIKAKFNIARLITWPLFMICFAYYQFFGKAQHVLITNRTEFILLLSFVIFLSSYSLSKKIKLKNKTNLIDNIVNRIQIDINLFTKNKFINIYTIVVICYCFIDLYINSILYGSLEAALIRFYSKPIDDTKFIILKNILNILYTLILGFIFIFRYSYNINGIKKRRIYISVLLLVFIAIPRGSRGAAISPLILIFMADCFAANYYGFKFKKNIVEYFIIIFTSITLILSLTVIRDINFEDIKDVTDKLQNFSYKSSSEAYSGGEGDLMISDSQFCFENFGTRLPFLSPIYTLYSITVSPIPRFLYPNKPVTFGLILNEAKLGGTNLSVSHTIDGQVAWAAGIAGEGWANAGYLGVIFYSIIFGIYGGFCSQIYYRLIKSPNIIAVLFALLFYQASASYIRGDLQSGTMQILIPLFILIIILKTYLLFRVK